MKWRITEERRVEWIAELKAELKVRREMQSANNAEIDFLERVLANLFLSPPSKP